MTWKSRVSLTKTKFDSEINPIRFSSKKPLKDDSLERPISLPITLSADSEKFERLIAIVGMPGAGKSVVVEHLSGKGWTVVHFGGITMRELEMRGLVVNETNERAIREELRRTHGMEAFAKLSLGEIHRGLSKGPTVIDGLYSWSEYKFLRNRLSKRLCVIAIFTPKHIRYQRLMSRNIRPLSYEEAEARDSAEIENLEKGGPIAMADYTIINSESLERLFSQIDSLLDSIAK